MVTLRNFLNFIFGPYTLFHCRVCLHFWISCDRFCTSYKIGRSACPIWITTYKPAGNCCAYVGLLHSGISFASLNLSRTLVLSSSSSFSTLQRIAATSWRLISLFGLIVLSSNQLCNLRLLLFQHLLHTNQNLIHL